MVRYHILVYGKVQGVGFRFYTLQYASQLHIKGWVRNKKDGTVEIDAEGSKEKMMEFISFIKLGSPSSQVDNIKVKTLSVFRKYNTFRIR